MKVLFLVFLFLCCACGDIELYDINGHKKKLFDDEVVPHIIYIYSSTVCHDCMVNLAEEIETMESKQMVRHIILFEKTESIIGRKKYYMSLMKIMPFVDEILFCDAELRKELSEKWDYNSIFTDISPSVIFFKSNSMTPYKIYKYFDLFDTKGNIKSKGIINLKKDFESLTLM